MSRERLRLMTDPDAIVALGERDWPEPERRVLPCGCGFPMVYRTADYATYADTGRRVLVKDVPGYRCKGCTLTAFIPEVLDAIDEAVFNIPGWSTVPVEQLQSTRG